VRKRDAECPERDFVHGRVVNVVCAVQADDGAERRPGAEGAGAEWSDARGGGAGVDLLGADEGEVGLDAVAEGDDGDLWVVLGCGLVGWGLFEGSFWWDVRRGAIWAGSLRREGGRM